MGKHGKSGPDNNLETQPMTTIVPPPNLDNFHTPGITQLEKDIQLIDGRKYADRPKGYRLE